MEVSARKVHSKNLLSLVLLLVSFALTACASTGNTKTESKRRR